MFLIIDANVLIDYIQTDSSILALAARHLGTLYVPKVILEEVSQLSEADCEAWGLELLDEPVDILLGAAEKRGGLSFEDHVCLLLAKSEGWICVSNDKSLHRECVEDGVDVFWGLRLMIELVRVDRLDVDSAREIAAAIHELNPLHVTIAILDDLDGKLKHLIRHMDLR